MAQTARRVASPVEGVRLEIDSSRQLAVDRVRSFPARFHARTSPCARWLAALDSLLEGGRKEVGNVNSWSESMGRERAVLQLHIRHAQTGAMERRVRRGRGVYLRHE